MSSRRPAARGSRLSAFDALIRGLGNLRVNWELVLAQWVQTLVVTLLLVGGLIPWVAAIDLPEIAGGPGSPGTWEEVVAVGERLLETRITGYAQLVLALFATLVAWLIGFLVYCWFQGGIYGILWTGDRQAPAGARDRIGYRTFNLRDFRGWGRTLAWRFFLLFNLFAVFFTLWALVPVLVVLLAVLGEQRWGAPAAFGIGCGGALPIFFGFLILVIWALLAVAAAARPDSGALRSTRDSMRVLGRRLGAVLLLLALMLIIGVFSAMFFTPLSIFLDLALANRPAAGMAASAFLSMLQWLISGAVSVWFAAATVALVRSELARGAAA